MRIPFANALVSDFHPSFLFKGKILSSTYFKGEYAFLDKQMMIGV
jgi:hypothetical protein